MMPATMSPDLRSLLTRAAAAVRRRGPRRGDGGDVAGSLELVDDVGRRRADLRAVEAVGR